MKSNYSNSKDTLIATRVTPRIKKLIQRVAASEGLYTSEWMRILIINELNRKELLTHKITAMQDFE